MYMNRNRRMHGCRHRFKRMIMSILVLSMLLTVTGCGGASQTAGSRLNTQNAVYPDDYPADQSQVIVTGVFETYTEEAGQTFYYCRLRDAEYQLISEDDR